jgi:hypothetical protein
MYRNDRRPAFDWAVHQQLTSGCNGNDVILRTEAEVRAWRQDHAPALDRHAELMTAINRRDRRNRLFLFGFGATVGLAFLTGIGLLAWTAWNFLSGLAG